MWDQLNLQNIQSMYMRCQHHKYHVGSSVTHQHGQRPPPLGIAYVVPQAENQILQPRGGGYPSCAVLCQTMYWHGIRKNTHQFTRNGSVIPFHVVPQIPPGAFPTCALAIRRADWMFLMQKSLANTGCINKICCSVTVSSCSTTCICFSLVTRGSIDEILTWYESD